MDAIVSLAVIGMACLVLMDVGCYLWLRHNEANRLVMAVARPRRPGRAAGNVVMAEISSDPRLSEQRGTASGAPIKAPWNRNEASPAAGHYVDPAAEAMSTNHNLSPAIHPRRD